jgi:hypothetical protein
MYPTQHLFFGVLFGSISFFIFPEIHLIGFLLLIFSTVFIDIDHYLYYIFKKKDFNLIHARKWYSKLEKKFQKIPKDKLKNIHFGVYFLHGIEALFVLIFLSVFSEIFLFILTGFIFHQFLDSIDLYKRKVSFYKIISFGYSLYYAKNKRSLDEYRFF